MASYFVESDRVQSNEKTNSILACYEYQSSVVERQRDGRFKVTSVNRSLTFKTDSRVPRVGCMLIGWGGNNGSTITACVLANKLGLSWRTKEGIQVSRPLHANYTYSDSLRTFFTLKHVVLT